MAAGVELATAYVTLAVESSAIGEAIGKGFAGGDKVAAKAGRNMGRAMAKGFEQEDPGADIDTLRKDVETAQAKIAAAQTKSGREQEAALRKVEIARAELTAAEAKGEAGKVAALKAADRLAIAEQKLEAATMKAAGEQDKLQKQLDESREALSKAEQAMESAAREGEQSAGGIRQAFAGVGSAIKKGMSGDFRGAFDEAQGAAGAAADDVRGKFTTAGSAAKSALSGDLKGAFATIRPAAASAADDVEQEFKSAGEPAGSGFMEDFGGALTKGVGVLGGLGLGLSLMEGFTSGMERERLGDKVAAQLDLAGPDAERAGSVAGSLFSAAYGESLEEVNDAVAAVMSSIPGAMDASEAALEGMTTKAIDLSTAFGVDVNEAVGSVGVLMRNGLAADADEAFDLMVGGMQKVPAGFRDELMPAITEYSKHFAGLGMDGEAAMNLLVRGAENGTIGVDKMGDAVKEFQIRSTDMSKATGEAYDAIGLDMEDMTNRLLAGGDTAEAAFGEIVQGLLDIEDPGERAAASIALFGTPLEDLGVDGIPTFLESLNPAGEAMHDFGGAAERMGNTLRDNAATRLEEFKRTISGGFTTIVGTAAGALLDLGGAFEPVTSFLGDTIDKWGPFAAGIGIVATAVGLWALATSGLATSAWAAAAGWIALNAPTLVMIGLIGLLVGAVIYAWNNFDWFRNGVLTVWDAIKSATSAVVTWFTDTAVPWLQGALVTLGEWFTWLNTNIIQPVWTGIRFIVAVVVGTLLTLWDGLVWVLQNVLGPAFLWLRDNVLVPVWQGIVDIVSWAWNVVIAPLFEAIRGFVANVLGPAFLWLRDNILRPVWQGIVNIVSWAWNVVIAPLFRTVVGFVRDTLGPAFTWLRDHAIRPAWDGITSLIGDGWQWLKRHAFDPLTKFVTEKIPAAFESARSLVADAWGKIVDASATPVEFVVNDVIRDGLIGNINKVLRNVGLEDKTIKFDGVNIGKWSSGGAGGSFATGGYTGAGGKYEPAGIVHRDEFVLRKEAQRDISRTSPGLLEAMNRFGSSALPFGDGHAHAHGEDMHAVGAPEPGSLPFIWGELQNAIARSGGLTLKGGGGYPTGTLNMAAQAWNGRAGVTVGVGRLGDNVDRHGVPSVVVQRGAMPRPGVIGYYSGRLIQMSSGNALEHETLIHEVGHALGLHHTVGGIHSIMDPMLRGGGARWPTSYDTANLRRLYGAPGSGARPVDGPTGGGFFDFDPLGWVFDKVAGLLDDLTGDGIIATLAKGVGEKVVDGVRDWAGELVGFGGGDDKGGAQVRPALFDGGGMLHEGVQLVEHRRRKPDRVLSAEQWDALYTTADSVRDGGTGTQVNVTVPEREGMDPGQFGRRVGEAVAFELVEVAGL